MMLTFEDIWRLLNESDESVEIEAKTAQQVGPSIQETISAFSNEPNRGGGYLLLGVRRSEASLFSEKEYEIVGLPDPDKIQSDLATMCRTAFNVAVRPSISVTTLKGGKTVIVAHIPEAQPHEKPVYIQSKGLPKGAFRRIGSTDQHCTDDDVQLLYQNRKHHSLMKQVSLNVPWKTSIPLPFRNTGVTEPKAVRPRQNWHITMKICC